MTLLILFQTEEGGGPAPSPIDVSLRALLCAPRITLEDYQSLVEEFNFLIDNQDLLTSTIIDYLDQNTGDGILTYEDRDRWIIYIAQVNLAPSGRTFGLETPSNIDEADPLGLSKDSLGNLRPNVLIIDANAENESTTQLDAPVQVTLGTNTCRTPSGALAKSPAGLLKAGDQEYNYQLFTRMIDIDEDGGAGSRQRFLQYGPTVSTTTLTVYIRNSDNLEVDHQIYLGKQPDADGGIHLQRLVIQGYPTDGMPQIRCGTQINEGTPDTIVSGGSSGEGSSAIRIGAAATQGRHNLWWKWLHFIGHRYVEDFNGQSGEHFAAPIFFINVGGNDGIGFDTVKFTEFQAIDPNNSQAVLFSDYVDSFFHSRPVGHVFTAIHNRSSNLTIKYCYFKAAVTSIGNDLFPFWEYGSGYTNVSPSGNSLLCRGVRNEGGVNFELGYSTFEGFCSGDYVGIVTRSSQPHVTGMWVHHNIITCNGYTCFIAVSGDVGIESISGIVEDNFIFNAGTEGIQGEGGLIAHLYGGEGTIVARRNILAQYIDGQIVRSNITASGIALRSVDGNEDGSIIGGIEFYENITWNAAITIGVGNGWQYPDTILNTVILRNNLIHGLPEPLKQENSGLSSSDSPVIMGVYPASLMSNHQVVDNNISRDSTDLNSTVAMSHEEIDNVGTQYTVEDEIIPGYQRNTAILPPYVNPSLGDFRLPAGNALLDLFSTLDRAFRREDMVQWDDNPLLDLCTIDFFMFTTLPNLGEYTTLENTGDLTTDNNAGDFTTRDNSN